MLPATPLGPLSVLQRHSVLSVYGRSFGVAPVLGMLGAVNSFDELEHSVEPWVRGMSEFAEAPVKVAPHLIYALARSCRSADDSCMIFLDASGVDLVEEYIKPAADRGMAVILDSQIGRLSPTYFIRRMIDAGYLAYPNVHVALDPEFATRPDQDTPGKPTGTLSAHSINQVQALLAKYVREEGLSHKKVLIVHQFVDDVTDSWSMVPASETSRSIRKSSWSLTPTASAAPTPKCTNTTPSPAPRRTRRLSGAASRSFSTTRARPGRRTLP